MRRPPAPAPTNEPLLFDLPLDHPARDDEDQPLLDRQPDRAPRQARQEGTRSARPPRRPGLEGLLPGMGESGGADGPPLPRTRQASPDVGRTGGTAADPDSRAKPAVPAQTAVTPTARAGATATAGTLADFLADPGSDGGDDAPVGIARRLAAGAADLLVHVAVAALALAGCRFLGVFPDLRDWPAIGIFLLSFSFVYTVVPLAFWGNTLGMTWAGLTSQGADGEPLSFDQTARRWLGMLLTLAVFGLPLLLAVGGRSLADRLSGSRTFLADS